MADLNEDLEETFEDEEEEELMEPKFKYKRILNDVSKIFHQDAASCFAVHDKFLALGTHWGRIYILDHLGNMLPNKVVVAHSVAVNTISIDKNGDYLASCSNDGKVFIYGLASTEYNQVVSMDRPIRSVAIDPEFSKQNSGQQYVTGDRVLVLHARGLFSRDKQQIIYAGKEMDGFIHRIVWKGPYITFANDTGVRVYDRSLKALITHVLPRHGPELRSELFPASITWLDNQTFAIGWAGEITICGVKENNASAGLEPHQRKWVEIQYMWDLPQHFVAGISFTTDVFEEGESTKNSKNAALPWKELVVLCLCRPKTEEGEEGIIAQRKDSNTSKTSGGSSRGEEEQDDEEDDEDENRNCDPRVWLLEPISFNEFELISEDRVEMRESSKLMCHHYHMGGLGLDNLYFFINNRDMIEAEPCSADDHVDWLLSNELYSKALEFTKLNRNSLEKFNPGGVGKMFLDHLLENEDYEEAAQLCAEVCGTRKDFWEEYINKFDQHRSLKVLFRLGRIPTRNPQLEPECYEMVLLDFLQDDVPGFRKLIKDWSSDLYRIGGMITQTLDKLYKKNLERETHNLLLLTLAQLYTHERKYERALAIYMSLGDKSVFNLIEKFHLFIHVKERIRELMDIDTDLAVRLMLDNEDSLPASIVMKQLTNHPKLQLAYLGRLFARNEGAEFANLAVKLYARHDPKRLLPFLRNYEYYKIDQALDVCKQYKLTKEVVFLLGRCGNRQEALKVIINEQKDIYQAMDFCKEHDDPDLWSSLISFGVQRQEFITILMQNIGTYIDPTILIQKIPTKMEIAGLPASLVKLLHDYSLQISLQEGCRRVTLSDCHNLLGDLMKMRKSGLRVSAADKCAICKRSLLQQDPRYASAIEYFGCRHPYHKNCLEREGSIDSCPVCSNTRAWLIR